MKVSLLDLAPNSFFGRLGVPNLPKHPMIWLHGQVMLIQALRISVSVSCECEWLSVMRQL
jgi:hypothetical protein